MRKFGLGVVVAVGVAVGTTGCRKAEREETRVSAAPTPKPDAAVPHEELTIVGTVQSADMAEIKVRDPQGFEVALTADEATQVTKAGSPIEVRELEEGTEVRASYVFEEGEKKARQVEVLSPAE